MTARPRSTIAGLILVSLLFAGTARAQDLPRSFGELKREHEVAMEALQKQSEAIRTDADRAAFLVANWAEFRKASRRACDWAEAHPDDPEAIDAIVWTVHGMANGTYRELSAERSRTFRLLAEKGLAIEKVVPVCYYADAASFRCPEEIRFLETALASSPNRLVRGAACLGLARADQGQADLARRLRDPIMKQPLEQHWKGDRLLEILASCDPVALDRRAEGNYRRLIAEFGDLKMPYSYNETPFAEMARIELHAMNDLGIGKTLPQIDGEDVAGRKLRLADHRGEVVAVVFWASWCGPCMGMVPRERDLVQRMAGKPFALIGVNGDEDRALAADLMAREKMTWPSFWNGGKMGGIVETLGVRGWPTIDVLDGAGVIRYKQVHGKTLDEAVDRLVAEAEAGKD